MSVSPAKSAVTAGGLAAIVESTLLRADATGADIDELAAEAMELGLAAVVVTPLWIRRARAALAGSRVRLVSVAGFPLGAVPAATKHHELVAAFDDGADEIDFVLSIGLLRGGDHAAVGDEFERLAREAHARSKALKVILECVLLAEAEVRVACSLALRSGIEYVKTSTGFGPRGATVEDVRLLRACVGDRAGVKAAGGIRTLAQALALAGAGATRLGTSAAGAIVREGGVRG
jgi:deoxyribose-phosphate aldolase